MTVQETTTTGAQSRRRQRRGGDQRVRAREVLRRGARRSTASTSRRAGHGARPARPQRRRQDHRRARDDDAAHARRRRGRASPASTPCATPRALRERIGLAGQYAAVDENLTGEENLVMVGRLYGERRAAAKARGRPSCSSASTSPTPPSGRSRRTPAACAAGSTSRPRSSPSRRCSSSTSRRRAWTRASRLALWETIEGLVADGTTVLLTTQYLDEADRLADRIAVIDHGSVIADGTSDRAQEPRRRRAARGHARGRRRARQAARRRSADMSDEPGRLRATGS